MNTYQDLTTINKNLSLLNKSDTIKLLPCLNEKYAYSSIYDDQASDIDVNTLYNLYLKKFKTNNGVIKTKTIIKKLKAETKKEPTGEEQIVIESLKISIRNLTKDDISERKLPKNTTGVVVTEIFEGSPLVFVKISGCGP